MGLYRYLLLPWLLLWRARLCIPVFFVGLLGLACASEPIRAKSASDCDQVEYLGGERGYPIRLPGTTAVLAEDYQPLPSSDDIPWWMDSQQVAEARAQKHLIAQPVPIHSPMFRGQMPQCAPNPALATAVQLEKEAEEAGEKAGETYGDAFGRVESEIDHLLHIHVSGEGSLLLRLLSNPENRDRLLRSWASYFDAIPELPTYSDEALARKALAGFQKGYHAGIDMAHQRAFLIDASADLAFMAIGGISGALESAGAKILDKALMRVRSMPIFVPGTVGGAGFFMKVARRATQGSSRELLKNMLAASKKPLDGEVPHHIVAHTDWRAEEARKILAKFDVGLDADPNGVFLPGTVEAPNPKGKAVHSTVHTNEYYRVLTYELDKATSKEEIIKTLQNLASRLEHGGL